MEVVIELASQRLTLKRDQAENILKNKVVQFDIKLIKHKKQLQMFKKKDPPILTMDEMIECVETVEAIVDRLKAKLDSIFSMRKILKLFYRKINKRLSK